MKEIEFKIKGLMMDPLTNSPIVVLQDTNSDTLLPIWVGIFEANAIALQIEKVDTPRPMTHDLMKGLLNHLNAQVTKIVVTELKDNTFYASITLRVNGQEVDIDSRPSDALAVAVRTSAPIFAAEEVIQESAIEFEHEVEDTEEVVDKFKKFLDEVTPEDFASG